MQHVLNYRSANDTGENKVAAVQPVTDGESATQTVFRRPTENIRVRTEVLRDLLQEHRVLLDSDGANAIWGGGDITFNGAYAGGSEGVVTFSGTLYIAPFATPGGGAAEPYLASTESSLTIGTVSTNQMTFTSVKKQWEGSAFPEADANAISIEIVHTGASTITVSVEGATGEENNIKAEINYGTHTCQDLKDALDAVTAVTDLITTTVVDSSGATAPKWDEIDWVSAGSYEARFLSGGAAATVHALSSSIFTTFFTTDDNKLRKGDTLCISFDMNVDRTGSIDGRFQSTPENANTAVAASQLFNSRLEPEKIPGSVPICACLDDDYVLFINGAKIKDGVTGTLTVDSDVNDAISGSAGLEVTDARTSDVYGVFGSVDLRLEAGDGEVGDARTSTYFNSGSPYASLDARLEAGDAEVDEARTSAVYGAQANLDTRLEQPESEINTARDGEASLNDRLNNFGSGGGLVSLGATGADYTDLEVAVAALNAGDGGVIHIKEGTYALTGNLTATKPISLIGVQENVVINISTYDLTLATHAHVSFLKIQGTAGDFVCGDATVVRGCTLACTVPHTGSRVGYVGCTFEIPSAQDLTLSSGERITFESCTFEFNHDVSAIVLGNASQVLFSSCEFKTTATSDADDSFIACATSATGTYIRFRQCRFDLAGDTSVSGAYIAIDDITGPVFLDDIYVVAKTTLASSKAILTLDTEFSINQLKFLEHTASSTTQSRYIDFNAPTGKACYVHMLHMSFQNASINAYPPIRFDTGGADSYLHVKGFVFTDIIIPRDVTPSSANLISLEGASSQAHILLEDGFLYVENTESSGALELALLGSVTGDAVRYTIRKVRVYPYITSAVTDSMNVFGHFNEHCTIEACHFDPYWNTWMGSVVKVYGVEFVTVRDCILSKTSWQMDGSASVIYARYGASVTDGAHNFVCERNWVETTASRPALKLEGSSGHEIQNCRVLNNRFISALSDGGSHVVYYERLFYNYNYYRPGLLFSSGVDSSAGYNEDI